MAAHYTPSIFLGILELTDSKFTTMAIKTSTFGRVELSGNDAKRFVQQVKDSNPNPLAKAALVRGREALKKAERGEPFQPQRNDA